MYTGRCTFEFPTFSVRKSSVLCYQCSGEFLMGWDQFHVILSSVV